MTGTTGWIELRCPRSLKGKLHPVARVIEIACHQGAKTRRGTHHFDWFDVDTGERLSEDQVVERIEGRTGIRKTA